MEFISEPYKCFDGYSQDVSQVGIMPVEIQMKKITENPKDILQAPGCHHVKDHDMRYKLKYRWSLNRYFLYFSPNFKILT